MEENSKKTNWFVRFLKKLKEPTWLLCFSLVIVLLFSFLANMVNTSLYSVSVKTVNFETESNNGNIEGLLYMPKSCSKDNPCPVIVTTHGYLNSKEMQDAPSIELSRRGYIVLAIDMYDHGGSTWDTPYQFGFYTVSLWDAVKWVYNQEYTLKDNDGNGMIAVSGHSMGGFSSEMAVMYDTMNAATEGHQKIAVSLSVGADYRYTSESIIGMFGNRSSGMIIAHYDEFFGDDGALGANTVGYKNYIETDQAKEFLGNGTNIEDGEEYEEGIFYDYAGGQRVIYMPNETHPMNHFSLETTAYMIDFYDEAFKYQMSLHPELDYTALNLGDAGGQTWWLKETFEFVALIALLVAIIPAFNLLLKVPFFSKVKTKEEDLPEEKEQSKGKKKGLIIAALVTSLIPAYYYPTFINKTDDLSIFTKLTETIICVCILFALAGWITYLVIKMVNKEHDDEKVRTNAWGITKGALIISVAALLLRHLTVNASDMLKTGYFYNAPTANSIGFWALVSASISLLVLAIVHQVARKQDGATIKSYGLAANIKQILIALLISIILFAGLYLIVFLIGLIFNTDFRLWVYAIKSFKWTHFVSFLRYVPIYFVFYFVNSIVVASNTKNVKGWKGMLYAIALNIGGLLLFMAYQYGKLFITGTAGVPTLALESILLVGLIPSLLLAAIFARKFYEKTNNIWTSAFFNTFLFTMIAIANTTVYLLAK